MLTAEPVQKTREPINDNGISKVALEFVASGTIPSHLSDSKPDKLFTRAFSSFPNKAFPFPSLLNAYINWSQQYVVDPRDTMFVTYILFSLAVVVPSTLYLLYSFSWLHAVLHTILLIRQIPQYILLMHCVCHKKAGTAKGWWVDASVHYFLGPFFGETINTFYYHHCKHHHVEDNGPDDLSSTIWYDRDNFLHFAHYYLRFYFGVGIELSLYFIRKKQYMWAFNLFCGEYGTLLFYFSFFAFCDPRSVIFAWFVPLNLARIGMMAGNWGQHSFLDPYDATNDYKTALTCIDSDYNTNCFNDGYHTSHHLNPVRHWQDHPEHFVANLANFKTQRTTIFRNTDFFIVWFMLMIHNYGYLADRLIFGYKVSLAKDGTYSYEETSQDKSLSRQEKIDYIKTRLRKLTPSQIEASFGRAKKESMKSR